MVAILRTANPASMKRTGAGLYAIKGASEKARYKGEGSNLVGSTGIRPFAEECLKLWLSRVHPSAVPQGSKLHSYFGLWKATLDQPPPRVLPQPDQLPF